MIIRNNGNTTSAAKQQASEKINFDNYICIPRFSLNDGSLTTTTTTLSVAVTVVVALFNTRSVGTKEK